MAAAHDPVMADEVVSVLGCRPGGTWVDATVGAGGHAAAILAATAPDGFLVGIDRDGEILAEAARRLAHEAARCVLVRGNFDGVGAVLEREGRGPADGLLLDLGISSLQLDRAERGFSFRADAPLDMRMDRTGGRTAAQVLAATNEEELAGIIREWGEEPRARRIARAILRARGGPGTLTTRALADVVASAVGHRGPRAGRIHPATRTFQALRIAVNRELEALAAVLASLPGLLAPGGCCCVIAYHSLEDRAVKRAFRALTRSGRGEPAPAFELITAKPLRPTAAEVRRNPRSRSARLRAVRRAA